MSKLPRIITSILFFAIGAGVIALGGSALLKASDWIMAIIYASFAIVGLGLVAIGWAAAKGEDIRDMLRDLFSGMSF